MNQKSYSFREKLLLIFLLLTSIASLLFFFRFKTFAFPEYNVSFSIDRQEAASQSKEFLSEMGINAQAYKDVTIFTVDDEAKTYLEREAGITQTEYLAAHDINLWNFSTRFF